MGNTSSLGTNMFDFIRNYFGLNGNGSAPKQEIPLEVLQGLEMVVSKAESTRSAVDVESAKQNLVNIEEHYPLYKNYSWEPLKLYLRRLKVMKAEQSLITKQSY